MDQKRGIGKNNKLLFQITDDMKRFRQLTTDRPVIMGRKTFESIGRPLPDRTNIIVTHNASFARGPLAKLKEIIVAHSLEDAMRIAKESVNRHSGKRSDSVGERIQNRPVLSQSNGFWTSQNDDKKQEEIFIIGGGQIYAQSLPLADKLYLTLVEGEYGADTFFPEYENQGFHVIREEKRESEGYRYTFIDLER